MSVKNVGEEWMHRVHDDNGVELFEQALIEYPFIIDLKGKWGDVDQRWMNDNFEDDYLLWGASLQCKTSSDAVLFKMVCL